MKSVVQKIARFSLILLIPTMITTATTSCQEDVDEPTLGVPGGPKKIPPGKK